MKNPHVNPAKNPHINPRPGRVGAGGQYFVDDAKQEPLYVDDAKVNPYNVED